MGCMCRRAAAIGSYWSSPTPDVPEGLEGATEEAVVEEPEEVSIKETEYLKANNKTHPLTTTIVTDGHSVQLDLHPDHIVIPRLLLLTKFARIPKWPPALATPARRSEAGPSCLTSRLNCSLDFRHGVWTRCGRRKETILPQPGGEAARI